MVKPSLQKGSIVDGYLVEECLHRGWMATLWRVSNPGSTMPMLMKIPKIAEGEDPAAIVSFEMEQMILPRLSGPHVPRFIAAGDFTSQPHIVMERIEGKTLYSRLPELPLPYAEVAAIGAKIALALDDLHRQHVIHLDIKPSNIMIRPSGEVVLLDFGLSHHCQLPDLMQEEFRLPYGSAPYMAPEQLRGLRNDRRSDIFALGALLYFFSTGVRPFGKAESLAWMRRRLWRDPVPPCGLRPDYPPWLQEIVLRCLEIEPSWRYPTAAQLAFDLANQNQIKLTARSERIRQDAWTTVLRRRFNTDLSKSGPTIGPATELSSAPIIAVAVDLAGGNRVLDDILRSMTARLLKTMPGARLACINVLKLGHNTLETTLDEDGHNKHIERLTALKHWAKPLGLEDGRLTVHVLEEVDPAKAILEFSRTNRVEHILIGARQNSLMRSLLGSVSARVAGEANCCVSIVRPARMEADPNPSRKMEPAAARASR